MKTISILGSTGSIGKQALEVAERNGYKVTGLTANTSVEALAKNAKKFGVKQVAIADTEKYKELKDALFGSNIEVLAGQEGVVKIASSGNADTVINSIVGIAGLLPTVSSIGNCKRLALANKESLVTGGSLVTNLIKEKGTELIPVDSEHSAIFQSLQGHGDRKVKKLLLTASGGPFFGKTKAELEKVTPKEALKHPNWSMGAKITIDSATMMNKGLEVIEAVHLFSVSANDIEVLIHRQSILHSAVEFCDGAVIGQLGVPDMKLPIQYAITYPDRVFSPDAPLDLAKIGTLTFDKPDYETFTCLKTCIDAINEGGLKPCAANGANEAAVKLFLEGKIKFLQIGELVKKATDMQETHKNYTLEDVFAADKAARKLVFDSVLN